MKKKYLLVIILLVIVIIFVFYQKICNQQLTAKKNLVLEIVGKAKVSLIGVADTDKDRSLGLGGRQSLMANEGLLFVFPYLSRHTFWMKDMNFDLDFIWIANEKIVDITEKVSHLNQTQLYSPQSVVDWVLEVNAGFVKRHQVVIGDQVKLVTP